MTYLLRFGNRKKRRAVAEPRVLRVWAHIAAERRKTEFGHWIGHAIIYFMKMIFEWDGNKARINLEKHKISFDEASTIFLDPLLITFTDDYHSDKEERFISIGLSERNRVLLAVHTEREEKSDSIVIRIISCRKATQAERKRYEKENE